MTAEQFIDEQLDVAEQAAQQARRTSCPDDRGPGFLARVALRRAVQVDELLQQGKRLDANRIVFSYNREPEGR